MEKTHAQLNRIFALVVLGISFFTYFAIVSPTVCFWDCGEYTATAFTLEVPHPPGNPFYLILGRVFSLALFFVQDIGYRLNLLTVAFDALMAMFIYLIVVRVMVIIVGIPDTTWKRLTVYIAGIVGALFAAFSSTILFCSVEAEVNGPLLLPIAICMWLALIWGQSKDPKRDRLLLLITFISFLGLGIHLYAMAVLVPVFLYVIIVDRSKLTDWRFWITGAVCGSVMMNVSNFIIGALIVLVITGVMSLLAPAQTKSKWRFSFLIALFAIMGFSSHLYIPIRSTLNPQIDENHPATWSTFKDYVDRKQYGSESMITRMFWRRATLEHQFGVEENMGFGGFYITQFFHFSPYHTGNDPTGKPFLFSERGMAAGMGMLFVYLIPTFLMFFGWWFVYKRNKNIGIFLIFIMVAMTIGMVFYHNFADGTRPEHQDYLSWVDNGKQGPMPTVHREVRVRDYFYIVGFMFYGMWVGIAAGALMYSLYSDRRKFFRTTLAPIATILFAVSPALPFAHNVGNQSRRGDFIPFDYAYNLLMSCERDGILFTNGDNDTFPLWALQEAYGIRRDVRIVNLSLANTQWYVKQLKMFAPQVPITFSEKQIDTELNHILNPFLQPTEIELPSAKIMVVVPGRQQQQAMRVQDQLVLNIIDSNKWKRPVYFAVTVSNDNFMGLDPYLQMQGLVYQVLPTRVAEADRVDLNRTLYLLDNVYKFRGLGDGSAKLNETSSKLLSNYSACFIQIAFTLRQPLQTLKEKVAAETKKVADLSSAKASATQLNAAQNQLALTTKAYNDTLDLVLGKINQCVSLVPWDWRPRMVRQELLMMHDRWQDAEVYARQALTIEPTKVDYLKMYAQALEQQGKKGELNGVLKKLAAVDTDPWYITMTMAKNYEEMGFIDSAIMVVEDFQRTHIGDRRAAMMLSQYQAMKSQPALTHQKDSAAK